ncbi:nucleotide pyrophosphohydrolase [Gordonia alkanivorans]|uniref:MazG family protein n=1 Tax=Gordonia alkanivorans TaxID=84096 RepID=UPI000FDF0FD9|nr:MazG family protein [Gordonia alkanivorans]AZZ83070.1 nucleotide pyrophosphohydrolase [Gordonia alkanivorans]
MTVVLLDPARPDLIPIRARAWLTGSVKVTEDVPAALLWEFDRVEPVFDEVLGETPVDSVLVSTNADHPLVRARLARGEQIITAAKVSGMALLDSVALMDTLRRNGPWESAQTHHSLRRYLLEEVYELLDAIEAGNQVELKEELGDLLLQVLFHARIAADDPEAPFDIDDVARSFTTKVMGRTPGVLSGAHSDLETQIREWEERKAAEKKRGSALDGVATTQPSLALLQKILERLVAASYPVDTIPAETWTVTVTADDDSIEAQTRDKALALMASVRDAEARASELGIELNSREAWESAFGG